MNKPARIAAPVRLPSGEGDNKRTTFSSSVEVPICLSELDAGGKAVERIIGTLPVGSTELYVQYRQCGDFYCFIAGKKQVSAVGDTREEAFTKALAQAA